MEGTCAGPLETEAGATDSSVEQSPEVEPGEEHVATRVTSRPTGRCGASGIPGGPRPVSHPRRPPRQSFGFVGVFDGRTSQGGPLSSCIRRERPRGRVRRGPVGNPSPTHLDGGGGRASVPRCCLGGLGGTTGGQRPQRCGTAAGEDQTFGGYALRGSGSVPSSFGRRTVLPPAATASAVVAWRS
jgi:hypothetical protein